MKDQKAAVRRRKAKQLRRHACQACYASRVKCSFAANEANCCDRCERQGRECVPRMVVRGTAKVLSPRAGNGAAGMTELDLNAFRSLALFSDLSQLVLYHVAAGALVKTYQSLGFDKPPQSLLWALELFSRMAMAEKSMPLLHAITTLAMSMSADMNFDNLLCKFKPVPETGRREARDMQEQVHREFAMSSASEAHFTICLGEVCSVLASPAYDFFFESEASMTEQLTRATQFRLWRAFVDDEEACDRFSIEMVKGCLSAPAPTGEPLRVSWAVPPAGAPLALRDKHGHRYSATLSAQAHLVHGGAFAVFTFGFKNIVPLDDGAVRCVREFEALFPCPSGQNQNQNQNQTQTQVGSSPCALAADSGLELNARPALLSLDFASSDLGGDRDTDGFSSGSSDTFSASSCGSGRELALDQQKMEEMDSADSIASSAWSDSLERMDENEMDDLMDSVLLNADIDQLNKGFDG